MISPWRARIALAAAVSYSIHLWRKAKKRRKAEDRCQKVSKDDVVIIGCGFSGICAAVKLKEAGIPFTILEKEADIGGTWFLNQYPGCACDIAAHLYSFSFARKLDWSEPYATQPEIHKYLRSVVDKYDLHQHIKLHTGVDCATWNEETCCWDLVLSDGREMHPKFLIGATGALHHARVPDVPGQGKFGGDSFHTAKWNHECNLKHKRVAIIGSAASAVQAIPHVAKQASALVILQRTPNWIFSRTSPGLPSGDYPQWLKMLFLNVPFLALLHRWHLYWLFESLFFPLGVFDRNGFRSFVAEAVVVYDMKRMLKGREDLLEKVLPTYRLGCKRICRTDDYLPALLRDNVRLIPHGLAKIDPDGIVDGFGEKHTVDVIIYATGFEAGSMGKLKIVGRCGSEMTGTSGPDGEIEAYLGVCINGFPNFFICLGPNTGLGHNSVVLMIESQVSFIVRTISKAIDIGAAAVDVKTTPTIKYYDWIWKEFDKRVWKHGGCNSWYKNQDGKIFALWPSTTWKYFWTLATAPGLESTFDII